MPASVEIRNNVFVPENVSITAGDSVNWTDVQGTHTVTSNPGRKNCAPPSTEAFDSGRLSPTQTFAHTFNTVGTFAYHCDSAGRLRR
jgi:plastocyanin